MSICSRKLLVSPHLKIYLRTPFAARKTFLDIFASVLPRSFLLSFVVRAGKLVLRIRRSAWHSPSPVAARVAPHVEWSYARMDRVKKPRTRMHPKTLIRGEANKTQKNILLLSENLLHLRSCFPAKANCSRISPGQHFRSGPDKHRCAHNWQTQKHLRFSSPRKKFTGNAHHSGNATPRTKWRIPCAWIAPPIS